MTAMTRRSTCVHIVLPVLTVAILGATPLHAAPDAKAKYILSNGDSGFVEAASLPDWRPQVSCGCTATGTGPTFNVEYLDVTNDTNMGFDDPADGATRRATLEAVFDYLSTVIQDTGSADIRVQESQSDGTGAVAFAGPLFLDVSGCTPPFTVAHITTGNDPFAGAPDGRVTVDFGYNLNTGLDDPTFEEIDLFSVLLHELTHALGFSSSLNSSCAPSCCAPVAGVDTRILNLDDLLVQGAGGTNLVSCTTGMYSGGDLEGGSGGVLLNGAAVNQAWAALGRSGSPPLFTPSTFACGASVSHWDAPQENALVPSEVVMQPALTVGFPRRTYHPLDVAALSDLGYDVGLGVDPCPWDFDGSGAVAFPDLTQLLAAWGPCVGCVEDVDASNAVAFPDLTAVLANWGACN